MSDTSTTSENTIVSANAVMVPNVVAFIPQPDDLTSRGRVLSSANLFPLIPAAPHTRTDVLARPTPYNTVMAIVPLPAMMHTCLLKSTSSSYPADFFTSNNLHGIGTLATGNLLPASITRHGQSWKGLVAQEG